MKRFGIFILIATFITACSDAGKNSNAPESEPAKAGGSNPIYDPQRGEGKFKDVAVTEKLDAGMATEGEKIYTVKCASCHKLTDEKLVGPGWLGVTGRHAAPWIMNFVTNTDAMLDKDPKAQAQLEICLVRMPNQNLADTDARALYEFMRKNDGIK